MKYYLIIILIISAYAGNAQTFLNPNFTSGTSSWGCNPETRPESVYGGPTSNRVAEVDASANLCQTISGFTIGSQYSLNFDCSRRTSCGPTIQSLDVIGSGGIINGSVSRNGTAYSLTPESFVFVATSTSHTFTLSGTSAGTCGLLVDNFAINLLSPLPVTLLNFDVLISENNEVDISWKTASEINNAYFTVLKSKDGEHWTALNVFEGAGNSSSITEYNTFDSNDIEGVSYYKLAQTDFDGTETVYGIKSIKIGESSFTPTFDPYPNPTSDVVNVPLNNQNDIAVFNAVGQNVTAKLIVENMGDRSTVNLSQLNPGIYYIISGDASYKIIKH